MSHCDPETLALVALGEDVAPADSAHVDGCEECSREVHELHELVALAREEPTSLTPAPDHLWQAVRAEAFAASGLGTADPPARVVELQPSGLPPVAAPDDAPNRVVALRPRRRMMAVAGIAAGVGALLGGGLVWAAVDRAGAPVDADGSTVLAQAVLAPLEPEVTQPGKATVLDSPDGKVVRVDATALPQREGFYEVWLIDRDVTRLVALGALPAGSIGTFTVPPGVSIADFPVVDISLEPLDGDPGHSHESLMRGILEA